ncbi:MAG: flap endonuclease-1 [Thermoprotei archaeon]|nr:MAG: flap endonuclease-1 [Thermoprotei archaeon]
MGVDLRELVENVRRTITLEGLRGKVIAIDAYNALYQFLTNIRQRDGTPLMDSMGRVTSHLNGLLYRTVNLIEYGIKPVYIFDGKPPELKKIELMKRMRIREEAYRKYEEALARGDLEAARIYAQQASKLTQDMVEEAKKLLDFMGIPWVQAPSEGEAQAAYMVIKGDAWATASQDYDSLLYGTTRLIRNLTITGRRKLPRRNIYIEIKPELILLKELLSALGITREQLVDIAILLGTDYNPGGAKGIGPKRALKLIREYRALEKIVGIVKFVDLSVDPLEIKRLFLNPEVTSNYTVKWREPDVDKVIDLLCGEHDFSEERVRAALGRAVKAFKELSVQTSLDIWFG